MTARRTPGNALGESLLLRLAGDRSFQRGKTYFKEGRVSDLLIRERAVTATVKGSRRYRVQLELGSGGIEDHDCSCPKGDEGDFCKHCVAVGLALVNAGAKAPRGKGKREAKPAVEKPPTWEKIAAHVMALPQEDLAEINLEAVRGKSVVRPLRETQVRCSEGKGMARLARESPHLPARRPRSPEGGKAKFMGRAGGRLHPRGNLLVGEGCRNGVGGG